jgi:hypothetical protein
LLNNKCIHEINIENIRQASYKENNPGFIKYPRLGRFEDYYNEVIKLIDNDYDYRKCNYNGWIKNYCEYCPHYLGVSGNEFLILNINNDSWQTKKEISKIEKILLDLNKEKK